MSAYDKSDIWICNMTVSLPKPTTNHSCVHRRMMTMRESHGRKTIDMPEWHSASELSETARSKLDTNCSAFMASPWRVSELCKLVSFCCLYLAACLLCFRICFLDLKNLLLLGRGLRDLAEWYTWLCTTSTWCNVARACWGVCMAQGSIDVLDADMVNAASKEGC